MNKRVFYLIILLLLVVSIFSAKIYINTKKEVLKENNYLILLESKLKKVYALKQKYKLNVHLLNRLKRFCNISDKGENYLIICKNLNSNRFNTVQNILFKNNFKLQKFDITKEKEANIKVEINK